VLVYFYLSHVLSPDDPVYPGNLGLKIRPQFSFKKGNPFNQCEFEMCNHIGTLVDLPSHFNPNGKAADEIDAAEWVFESPVIADIPKGDGEVIEAADLAEASSYIRNCDLLLIRTGFERFRSDHSRYARLNPALGRSLAKYAVEKLPLLRAIGIDVVSAGNVGHPDDAIAVHRTLLGYPDVDSRYILVIEDMSLQHCPAKVEQVIVLPLRVKGLDGVPCTVLARS
jgi:arylformamidase